MPLNSSSSPPPPPPQATTQDYVSLMLQPGAHPLPEYELVRPLGRGGMGEVWQAVGPGGVSVALKFIALGGAAGRLETRSLELMKNVRHPHLLALFGAWQRGDCLILAMELADRTLMQRWQEAHSQGLSGIPAEELREYMREAAKGLDFLNEPRHPTPDGGTAGIQHKDVKPQNLLLVGGAVKVADFGLAKVLEQTSGGVSGGLTPLYAAPEFFDGRATRWSDQYSLAATYCQLRGGRPPFQGSMAELTAGHLTRPPDLSMLPESERPAAARALSKKPEERWPNCRAFVDALAPTAALPVAVALPFATPALSETKPLAETKPWRPAARKPRPRFMLLAALGVVIVLVAALLGLWFAGLLGGSSASLPPPRKAPPNLKTAPKESDLPARPPPVEDPAIRISQIGYQTIERGGNHSINFPMTRTQRSEPMELRLTGLPPGVTADPVAVEENKDAAVVTLAADQNAEVVAWPVRLEATCAGARSEMDFMLAVVDRAEQDKAAETIKRLGGLAIVNDMHPGKPINGVIFSNMPLKDGDLAFLDGLTALNHLAIVDAPITDEGLKHLRGLLNLSDLELVDDEKVTDAGCASLRGLTALYHLSLNGDRIGDAGLEQLEGLTGMSILDLQFTKVTDAGLGHLREMKALTWLLLHGTKVSDAGLADIKGFPLLNLVDLGDTQVTDAGVKDLQMALPKAHITH